MGAEELTKRRQSHDKYIDRRRVELATPDLFTQMPENQSRSCVGTLIGDAAVSVGESLVIEAADNSLLARRGNSIVLTISDPPVDVLTAVRTGAGVASGTVQHVYKLSRNVQVTIK
jgi:hypothetical protein